MKCYVYKSLRRADTYVYLKDESGFALLPPELAEKFGTLEYVMPLELTPERKLARSDPEVVRRNLAERGYHVQFPPPNSVAGLAGPVSQNDMLPLDPRGGAADGAQSTGPGVDAGVRGTGRD